MEYYATLLNPNSARCLALELKDIFDHLRQANVFSKILCGSGFTRDESMNNAMNNLVIQGIMETFECAPGVYEIINHCTCKDSLCHLWLSDGANKKEPKLYPLPYHDKVIDFCSRYSLQEKAKDELALLFTFATCAKN